MGIGSVGSFNRMSGMQILSGSTDTKSKSIQKEITDAQQQIKKLSSKEEINKRSFKKKYPASTQN